MFGALSRRRPPIRKEGLVDGGTNGEDSPHGAACALLTPHFLRRGVFYLGFARSAERYSATTRTSPARRYPASRMLEKSVNTREGIAGLAKASLLETLLKELDEDGSEIGGAMLELNALVNYVTQNEKMKEQIKTHSQFITHQLEQ